MITQTSKSAQFFAPSCTISTPKSNGPNNSQLQSLTAGFCSWKRQSPDRAGDSSHVFFVVIFCQLFCTSLSLWLFVLAFKYCCHFYDWTWGFPSLLQNLPGLTGGVKFSWGRDRWKGTTGYDMGSGFCAFLGIKHERAFHFAMQRLKVLDTSHLHLWSVFFGQFCKLRLRLQIWMMLTFPFSPGYRNVSSKTSPKNQDDLPTPQNVLRCWVIIYGLHLASFGYPLARWFVIHQVANLPTLQAQENSLRLAVRWRAQLSSHRREGIFFWSSFTMK